MFLDYFALFILLFVVVFIFYGVIVIHDIPYEIAKKRNHPQQDALHVAGWVSLFTLHAIWPFLWIWATLYREDRGWGFKSQVESNGNMAAELAELKTRLAKLEAQALQPTESVSNEAKSGRVEPTLANDVSSTEPGEK